MSETMQNLEYAKKTMQAVSGQLQVGLVGTADMADILTDSFFAGQHVLFEGEPGVGKTESAKRLAIAIGNVAFGRVQGAPDKLPSDIIGIEFYDRVTNTYIPRKGPVSSDVLLLDELNRINTKTQSGLYDAMSEGHVMIGTEEILLPEHFFVVATQNPHATGQGTFPISDPFRDRFGMSTYVGTPDKDDRLAVGRAYASGLSTKVPKPVTSIDEVTAIKDILYEVTVRDDAIDFVASALDKITRSTGVEMKASGHRSMIAAIDVSRARTVRTGEAEVTIDTMRSILPNILRHRFEVDTDPSELESAKQQVIQDLIC